MALFECCRICMLTFFTRCYVMLLADVPYCLLQCSVCLQMIDKFHLCICEWKTFFLIWHLLFQSFIWSINPIFANANMLMLSESCIVPLCRCLFWIFCLHFLSSLIDSPFVFFYFSCFAFLETRLRAWTLSVRISLHTGNSWVPKGVHC